MDLQVNGKQVLVTGASADIGKAGKKILFGQTAAPQQAG